jgi:hypothetical protein
MNKRVFLIKVFIFFRHNVITHSIDYSKGTGLV